MKLKTKIKLGAAAIVGTAAIAALAKGGLDALVKANLSKEGVTNTKHKVMSKKNQEDFANSPEVILGQLFYASTPQINVTILNRDNKHINALLYKNGNENSKYALLVHGYRSTPKSLSYIARRYYENGYNVLIPYMRAHQGSDYEYSTMGWLERFDIIDWINYIDSIAVEASIVLHGVSMGGATVMMVTGESLPSCVRCAVEDCGYTSVYDAYSHKIPKIMKLPAFPSIDLFRHAIKKKVGFDIKEASALDQVRKSCTPTLFIHGENDTVVPVSMVHELYASATCKKDILICPRADHAMSPLLDPDRYWNTVWNFIDENTK
jgi:fermentation-respiration switch protein FrsA (DUF1100 family)